MELDGDAFSRIHLVISADMDVSCFVASFLRSSKVSGEIEKFCLFLWGFALTAKPI